METSFTSAVSAPADGIIGHITIRVPIIRETEHGGFEDPYTASWLTYGTAELIEHDLTEAHLAHLGEEIYNGDVMADFAMPTELTALADAVMKRQITGSDV